MAMSDYWYFSLNNSIVEVNEPSAYARFVYNIVAFFTSTVGFTVVNSSNGAVVSIGSSNWPVNPASLADYSWLVLECSRYQVCFQLGPVGSNNPWGYILSQGKLFIGGDATTRPSAVDEIVCGDFDTNIAYAFNFGTSGYPTTVTQHIVMHKSTRTFVAVAVEAATESICWWGLEGSVKYDATLFYMPWRLSRNSLTGASDFNALALYASTFGAYWYAVVSFNSRSMRGVFFDWSNGMRSTAGTTYGHRAFIELGIDPLNSNEPIIDVIFGCNYTPELDDNKTYCFPLGVARNILRVRDGITFYTALSNSKYVALDNMAIPWDEATVPA